MDSKPSPDPGPSLTVLRVIVISLASGLVVFLTIAVVLRSGMMGPPFQLAAMRALTYIAVFAFIGLPFVRSLVVAQMDRQIQSPPEGADDPESAAHRIIQGFVTRTIISAALVEGIGFLAGLAFLVEGQVIAFGIALLAIAGLFLHVPTLDRFETWRLAVTSDAR